MIVHDYADDVAAGKIIAGPHVRDTCQRHLKDLQRNDGLYFDEQAAQRVINFFARALSIPAEAGGRMPFEVLGWQAFVLGSIFGWKKEETGFRRFIKSYIETAKGSGKTPLAGGVGLYCTVEDKEDEAEGYVCARTGDQALVTFRPMAAMVRNSDYLKKRCRILGGLDTPKNISYYKTMSFIRRVATETTGKGHAGPKPHFVLADEYHEHETSKMLDAYDMGTKARRQPIVLIITNAGSDEHSPCGEEHDYAVNVARGETKDGTLFEDDTYFSYVCAHDKQDDPFNDPECWIKTNPSLPDAPGYAYIERQVRRSQGLPSKKAEVERLNFCIWGGSTATPWFERQKWVSCEIGEDNGQLLDENILKVVPCFGGLDLALYTDLCAGALVWDLAPHEMDKALKRYAARLTIWTPEDTLDARAERDGVPYRQWADDGFLVPVPGEVVRFDWVAKWIKESLLLYNLKGIAYDPQYVTLLMDWLDEYAIETVRDPRLIEGGSLLVAPHHQGFKAGSLEEKDDRVSLYMPRSINAIEESVLHASIEVQFNPVLRWAALGTVVILDASHNRRLSKTKSKTRIDPMMALTMARGLSEHEFPEPEEPEPEDFLLTMGG